MDIAVNLVESYLRINGYLTLTEFEVQARNVHGSFDTVTDVDIMAIRFPGVGMEADDAVEAQMLTIADPALRLEPDQIDVVIGEVKQGLAQFNPGLRRREVLHSVLHCIRWLFERDLDGIVDDLSRDYLCLVPGRGGGTVRVRLVAFGRSEHNDLHTIGHRHIVATMLGFVSRRDAAFRPVQFRDPAPAMLSLLLKAGIDVSAPEQPPSA